MGFGYPGAGVGALGAGATYLAGALREDRQEAEDKRRWEAEHQRQLEVDAVLKALRDQQITESQEGIKQNRVQSAFNRARMQAGQPASEADANEFKELGIESLLESRGGQAGELPSRSIMGMTGLAGGTQPGNGISAIDPLRSPGTSYFRRLITPEDEGALAQGSERIGIDRERLGLDRDELAVRQALGERGLDLEERGLGLRGWEISNEAKWRQPYADYYRNRALQADWRVMAMARLINRAMDAAVTKPDKLMGWKGELNLAPLKEAMDFAKANGLSPEQISAASALVRDQMEAGAGAGAGATVDPNAPPPLLDPRRERSLVDLFGER